MSKNKKISSKEVEYIAQLARINLTWEEKKKFSKELSDILGYVEQLQEVNTENIEPISQVAGMVNVIREDVAKDSSEKEKKIMAENFPEEKDGYIKVKQVMQCIG